MRVFHTQESREKELSFPQKCLREDAWLGEAYYFWKEIEDAEDCQNLNNYRNEKGKSSRLDGYDYLVSFAQYNIYGRSFFVFGGVYKVEIAKPKHYEIGGYNISLLFHR